MARRRKGKRGRETGWDWAAPYPWVILGAEVLTVAFLGVVLGRGAGRGMGNGPWLYLLLGLAVLALGLSALLAVRSLSRRTGRRHRGPDLGRELGSLLAGTVDPTAAASQAVRLLQEALGVERVALFAVETSGRHAELLAEAGVGEEARPWAGRLALQRLAPLAEVLAAGRPVVWPEIASLRFVPESARLLAGDLPSLCLHPIVAGSAPLGFLALADRDARSLAPLQQGDLLDPAAQMLALFIRTAGLQPDVLRAQDQIELLYEVTTHLNTDLSLDKVMTNVLTQAVATVGATRGSVFLLDESGRVAHRILAQENLGTEVSSLVIREVMERGLAAWVMEHRVGTLVEDTLQDGRWLVLPDHAGKVRSAVAVPFLRHGKVQGMLFLTHPEVSHFRQEHLELLTSIANQAAIAIQNARLYEQAENERRTLAAVLDSSADAIVVANREGRVLLANPAACQIMGIENRAELLRDLIFHPGLLEFLERAGAEEGTVSKNVRLEDGRTFGVSVAPVRDDEGQVIGRVAVMHDITYLVELDEMKSRFVSTVSHDLKAPLTSIRGFADLLKEVGPLNDEQTQFVGRIRQVANEMSHLISNLLDLGRIEAGLGIVLEPVNLREVLLSGKYNMAGPAQEKGILIDVEVPADLPQVQADPFRLQQVMANLLSNAVKYTPRGGHIRVRALQSSGEVVVSVSDSGIGIPAGALSHLFEKFYRVDDSRVAAEEGSGLGLAIVKSVVEEHGGRVWAESALGKGSTFYFSLPLSSEKGPSL